MKNTVLYQSDSRALKITWLPNHVNVKKLNDNTGIQIDNTKRVEFASLIAPELVKVQASGKTEEHYFKLGAETAKYKFNARWFWGGLALGLQIGIALMYFAFEYGK